ncbi:MAG: DUF998 domain-containing protein [Thaumarchaeota archaeon]|nr:DUF998 domain-containing protein [Nitrososphaerota archaeon]
MAGPAVKAGALIFVGGAQYGIGLILAEIFYPNYNVATNTVSDLGATCGSTCQIFQPSSTIFNGSIVILGVLFIIAAYLLKRASFSKLFIALGAIAGVGAVGVGTFPETTGIFHSIFSLIVFLFAGLSAIAAYRVEKPPLTYLSVILGLFTLVSLVLYVGEIYLGLGPGGMERMIVYPVLLWVIGFGGHLMSLDNASA